LKDKIKNYKNFDKKSKKKKRMGMKLQETNKIYKPFKKKSKEWRTNSRDEKLKEDKNKKKLSNLK
jgi:hypothetical protein